MGQIKKRMMTWEWENEREKEPQISCLRVGLGVFHSLLVPVDFSSPFNQSALPSCFPKFRVDPMMHPKISRPRCLLHVKGLVICFYLGWSGSILQFRQNIIKVGSKSWLLTCSSSITLNLPSYTGSALKRELNFCNSYLSLLYFWRFSDF